MQSQLSPNIKPYSRNKPKKKYESLNDTGCEINKFIRIISQVEMHNEDGKGYVYAILNQLYPKSREENALIRIPNRPTHYRNYIRL
jgi:hypothetical protein